MKVRLLQRLSVWLYTAFISIVEYIEDRFIVNRSGPMHFSLISEKNEKYLDNILKEYIEEDIDPEGLKKLGSGCGACVFEWKGKAVKLCDGDDGSDIWLRWALRNQDNPFCPKIFYYKQKKKGSPYVCVMEKLKKVAEVGNPGSYQIRNYLERMDLNKDYRADLDAKAKALFDVWLKADRTEDFAKVKRKLLRHRAHLDLHSANYMWRGVGKKRHVVITDPIYTQFC